MGQSVTSILPSPHGSRQYRECPQYMGTNHMPVYGGTNQVNAVTAGATVPAAFYKKRSSAPVPEADTSRIAPPEKRRGWTAPEKILRPAQTEGSRHSDRQLFSRTPAHRQGCPDLRAPGPAECPRVTKLPVSALKNLSGVM